MSERCMEELRYSSTILNLALGGGEWLASHPCCFTPGNRDSGTHWIGSQAATRASLDSVEKRNVSCPYQESDLGCSACSLVAIPTELSPVTFNM
jgi:hypothetical protein